MKSFKRIVFYVVSVVSLFCFGVTAIGSADILPESDRTEQIDVIITNNEGGGFTADYGKQPHQVEGKVVNGLLEAKDNIKNSMTSAAGISTTGVYEETYIAREIMSYEIEYIETDELMEGEEEVIQEGATGEKEKVIMILYVDGVERTQEVIDEWIIDEPINQIIRRGTGKVLEISGEAYKYTQELTMNATAYTAGYESTGKSPGDPGYGITASGEVVRHGIVSVDPSVIPLGTKLYVEGYGLALAADTGSAIVGHKIDLYYESLSEAYQFGRQSIKVYVLK